MPEVTSSAVLMDFSSDVEAQTDLTGRYVVTSV